MWRVDSLEKTLMLEGIGGRRRRGWQRMRWLDGITDSMASTQTWVWGDSGSWWWTRRPGVLQFMKSQRVGHDWATELNWLMFPPCSLASGQTMLGVMAISFKRTYVDGCSVVSCDFGALPGENAHATAPRTVVFSSSDPTTGHCQPMPPPETPGYSQASLAQSLIGSLLLSSGFWCTQGFMCTPRIFVPRSVEVL